MLKRSGAISLTMLYIVTVLGFALNLHYCGTQISSVNINAPAVECSMAKIPGKMKCCKDSQLQVKVKDAHQAEPESVLAKVFGFELPRLSFDNIFLSTQHTLLEKLFDRSPPDEPAENIASFIKNCIFRI